MAWFKSKKEPEEPTVRVRTGRQIRDYGWGGAYTVDEEVELTLVEAVKRIIEHLDLQLVYEPAQPSKDAVKGKLYKPEVVKEVKKKRVAKKAKKKR